MDKKEQKKWGKRAGALGLFVLTLNLIDFFAGWNKIADETALVGVALIFFGVYFALK